MSLCAGLNDAAAHAVEDDGAAGDLAAGPGERHGGEARGGLAGARLADEAQHLAPSERDVDALDDLVPFVFSLPVDSQAAYLQQETTIRLTGHREVHSSCAETSRRRS
jgi:hypothetical protein